MFYHRIIKLLEEIDAKLDLVLAAQDFSKEDAIVVAETQIVKDATGHNGKEPVTHAS